MRDWPYDEHPGDCCPRVVDGAWTTCCPGCAGTGVFPVPWVDTIEQGRADPDAGCVACKETGRAIVAFAADLNSSSPRRYDPSGGPVPPMDTARRMHLFHFWFALAYLTAMFVNGAGSTLAVLRAGVSYWPFVAIHVVLFLAMLWHTNRVEHWGELRRADLS